MNDLVNDIAAGTANLLSAEDICTRLSVSRSTFDRWVRNGSSPLSQLSRVRGKSLFAHDSDEDGSISFPPPDIRIGNSPRWALETFKGWLRKNLTKAQSLG